MIGESIVFNDRRRIPNRMSHSRCR